MQRILLFLRHRTLALKWIFLGSAAASVVFDTFAQRHAAHFWGDGVRGFWALFAFAGCIGMIALFKGIYHVWLMKEPEYYD